MFMHSCNQETDPDELRCMACREAYDTAFYNLKVRYSEAVTVRCSAVPMLYVYLFNPPAATQLPQRNNTRYVQTIRV